MSAFVAGVVLLAQVIHAQPAELTTQAAMEKFDATCNGKKSPECDQLRWRLEYALYEDLVFLARTSGTLDDGLLRIGAAADVPQLKAFCLDRIHDRGLQKSEHALVIAALDDPYPLVRWAAQNMVGELPDEKYSRMLAREPSGAGGSGQGVLGLIAGTVPDAKKLGAPPYPGATYRFFASDRQTDFFTSPDSPEKVLAFYAKGGKKALTEAQLSALGKAATTGMQKDPMAMSRMMQEAMEKGEDPQKAIEEMTKGATSAGMDWGQDIEGGDGIVKPRYVVLTTEPLFGMQVPTGVVAVFKDEIMGATSIVFLRQAPSPAAQPMRNQKEIDAMNVRLEILSSPDAGLGDGE